MNGLTLDDDDNPHGDVHIGFPAAKLLLWLLPPVRPRGGLEIRIEQRGLGLGWLARVLE